MIKSTFIRKEPRKITGHCQLGVTFSPNMVGFIGAKSENFSGLKPSYRSLW